MEPDQERLGALIRDKFDEFWKGAFFEIDRKWFWKAVQLLGVKWLNSEHLLWHIYRLIKLN